VSASVDHVMHALSLQVIFWLLVRG